MSRSKECFKCKTVKPLESFYKHSQMADGHLNKCKECAKHDANKHRSENLEKIRAYDRERGKKESRIKQRVEVTRAWREQDKRRFAAHKAVANAIKKGELTRQPCEVCNHEKTVGHHDDYDKPLSVRWLCQPCHMQHHHRIKKLMESS
jgi:hypothetical protein